MRAKVKTFILAARRRFTLFHATQTAGGAILGIGLGLVIYGLLTGGGGHRQATYRPTGIERVTVCPSSWHRLGRIENAAAAWAARKPACPTVQVTSGTCEGEPYPGELQVRSCFDALDYGGVSGCPLGHWDVVVVDREQRAGVAYIELGAPPGVPAHIIGHAIGVGVDYPSGADGHTTRAASIMAREPGTDWGGFGCTE